MSVKIGHASIDENGKVAGGREGDQTTKEICVRDWYDKPWNVYLECTDDTLAKSAVEYMKQVCSEDGFGYDQNQRNTGYVNIIKNGRKVKGAKGEFDCSSLVSTCYNLAGITGLSVNNTTRTLRNALLKTGLFVEYQDSSHLMSGKFSKPGGIYLSEGHHVVMVVENKADKPQNPFATPETTVEFGELGISVRWVQWELCQAGFTVKIDGEFLSKTDKAVRAYQEKNGLEVDGKVGPETRTYMIKH